VIQLIRFGNNITKKNLLKGPGPPNVSDKRKYIIPLLYASKKYDF
jgi:hypothetical protein